MNRRDFVLLGATGVVALAVPVACADFRKVNYDPLLEQPQSLSSLVNVDQINSIGTKFREQVSNENTVSALVKKLLQDIPSDEDNLVEAIDEKIKNDFNTGTTTVIEGWVLALTEARQCALSSLTNLN